MTRASSANPWTKESSLFFGAGLGMEFNFTEHVALSLDIPLVVKMKLKPVNEFNGVYPIPSASLTYYF
jgi:hypothetical protein